MSLGVGVSNVSEGTVDYERSEVYHLIVSARDRGPDAVATEATVIVRVDDVNDHAPHVTVNTLTASGTDTASVSEDVAVGTFVGHVIVNDPDRGASGRFNCNVVEEEDESPPDNMAATGNRIVVSVVRDENEIDERDLLSATSPTHFRLQQMSSTEYHLVTSSELDRERRAQYRLTIVCRDGNDNKPEFNRPRYTAEIYENNYGGATVIQVGRRAN